MTLAKTLNIPTSKHDHVTEYFTLEQMYPDTWTYPVSDKGIEGIELLHKAYGLWKDVVKQNNLGRVNGTNSSKVAQMIDDIRTNHVESSLPPVYIDIDTGDIMIHLFHKDAREYYQLESLWSNAEKQ